jgi:hypothetical protein
MEIVSDAVPDTKPESRCERWGKFRDGATAVAVGAFQRLGVTPDGRTVLFELNTRVAEPSIAAPRFSVPEEGIFAVGPDGHVRALGPASAEKAYRYGSILPGFADAVDTTFTSFSFSPNSRYVAFSDRGPGVDASDAAQIVVMNLGSGKRRQLTHFVAPKAENPTGANALAVFLDDDTLVVFGHGQPPSDFFRVRRNGGDLRAIYPPPLDVAGGMIAPSFALVGRFGATASIALPSRPATGPVSVSGPSVEVFAYHRPDQFVQLTQFGRSDTRAGPSLETGNRVFFRASANSGGQNPANTCQLFSVDRLGSGMRQLTHFVSRASPPFGCLGSDLSPDVCQVGLTSRPEFDARVGTLVFDATCDPSGNHPGGQVFAIRRDGSGLRRLTNYRGMHGTAADGTLTVELPGPIETSGSKY